MQFTQTVGLRDDVLEEARDNILKLFEMSENEMSNLEDKIDDLEEQNEEKQEIMDEQKEVILQLKKRIEELESAYPAGGAEPTLSDVNLK